MSSIIAKPLRRQSHRWHSSFAVVPWRNELLRSNLSDFAGLAGTGTEAVNHSGGNALHWELRGQTALIMTGNHIREQQTIVAEEDVAQKDGARESARPTLRA
jgi:hypothetical protein